MSGIHQHTKLMEAESVAFNENKLIQEWVDEEMKYPGVRVLDEARAWRMRKKLKPKKGEFKDLNPRSFKDLAIQFGLAPTTINRNYNEAVSYHKLRKRKKSKRSDESTDSNGSDEEEKEASKTSVEALEEQPKTQEEPMAGTEEVPEIPQTFKQEPIE